MCGCARTSSLKSRVGYGYVSLIVYLCLLHLFSPQIIQNTGWRILQSTTLIGWSFKEQGPLNWAEPNLISLFFCLDTRQHLSGSWFFWIRAVYDLQLGCANCRGSHIIEQQHHSYKQWLCQKQQLQLWWLLWGDERLCEDWAICQCPWRPNAENGRGDKKPTLAACHVSLWVRVLSQIKIRLVQSTLKRGVVPRVRANPVIHLKKTRVYILTLTILLSYSIWRSGQAGRTGKKNWKHHAMRSTY